MRLDPISYIRNEIPKNPGWRTDHNLLIPEAELKGIGAELHYTQSGGDITFHGPHQAILYPVISLRSIGIGAKNYVETLERSMVSLFCNHLHMIMDDLQEMRSPRTLEVWKLGTANYLKSLKLQDKLLNSKALELSFTILILKEENISLSMALIKVVWVGDRKIGAIGVHISSGITSHGLACNIDTDLKYFEHIVPCGIAGKEVTSLRRETDTLLPSEEVIHEQLVSCLAKAFSYDDFVWKEDPSFILDNQEKKSFFRFISV
ncbi:hypothetical protein YC2023_097542 [Brassica napus]